LHKALINKPKNFIRAKFFRLPKNLANVSDKMLILFLSLMLMVRNLVLIKIKPIEYQGHIQIFERFVTDKSYVSY